MFLGFHVEDIPADADLMIGLSWNYAAQLLYNPVLALVKISVLVFLYRLGGHRTSVLYAVYFVGICESTTCCYSSYTSNRILPQGTSCR